MKKAFTKVLVVALLLAVIPLAAKAATPRATGIFPGLSFNGTTATCTLTVSADATDSISAEVKLWRGGSCLKTWYTSGSGLLTFSRTATVSRNTTYTVTADVTINGVAQQPASITKTNN